MIHICTCRNFHHHTFASREQWSDEHKKDVINKKQHQQYGTNFKIWQSDVPDQTNTECNPQDILKHPGITKGKKTKTIYKQFQSKLLTKNSGIE